MRELLILLSAVCMTYAFNTQEIQSIKSVKGGNFGGGFYNGQSNLDRFYGNFSSENMRKNLTGYKSIDFEIGVCYVEVPTASLARDPTHVPAGNGSSPALSRIRTCCKGYIRNIHNFKICEPVCSEECVNALCTAPEVCTCYPDHVRNLAGFCIPTCPIGCQNGNCAGGECLCKDGYKLDTESKFCLPSCKENCGGLGNCTTPNTCECKTGYESTADGSCVPHCEKCLNGQCVAPGQCKCHSGFVQGKDGCKPVCDRCNNGDCVGPNDCQCFKGFAKSPQGDCSPVCEYCLNGDCVAPNECKCHSGYEKNKGQCAPVCAADCEPAGKCIDGQCRYPSVVALVQPIQPGNQFNPNPSYQPNQYPGNQPNQYPGNQPNQYPGNQPNQYLGNQHNQYPGNQPNQYPGNQPNQYPGNQPNQYPGNQTEPNPWYNNLPTGQVSLIPSNQVGEPGAPQCPYPCINGKCTERNLCLCNYGYVLDRNDPTDSRCIPNCPGGCRNGICSAPYFCLCNVGFVKDFSVKGREACVKRDKRSADEAPINVAEFLVFNIPDNDN